VGTALAPLTPDERRRLARQRQQEAPQPVSGSDTPPAHQPLDPDLVGLLSGKGAGRPGRAARKREKSAAPRMRYPVRAYRLGLGLALLLAVLSAGVALVLPPLLAEPPSDGWAQVALGLFSVPFLVLLVGFPCGFLDCVLATAVEGEDKSVRWSGSLLQTVLRAGAKWLGCFLAGPVVFAALGCLYWVRCGEPDWADWLILAQMGVVGAAYGIFALLAVTDSGRWRDLNPVAVADLAHRLGGRGLGLVLAAAALLLAHGMVLSFGVEEVHRMPPRGGLILVAGWASGLFFGAFFCRLLGAWCRRTRHLEPTPEASPVA
jgi:hypothetical protein